MAGDKKYKEGGKVDVTDIVRDVHILKGMNKDVMPKAHYDWEDKERREGIGESVSRALSEKHPTAGGTYEGSVYYSNILPQGEGDIPWSKKAATIVKNASQTGAKKSDILAAQNYFAKIGYMHPSEVDGMPGRQFRGMVSRWNKNAGVSKEAIFDKMKTWKDKLFDGGAEEYEEDLREGGGDQGPY